MTPAAYILPSSKIDADKWNNCILSSDYGMIYASTGYLDAMADQWHGIVIDDYRAVMAVPWRIRFGIRYAYMPAFIQQLGLTGAYTAGDMNAVIRTLPDFVSLADIHFNYRNTEITGHPGVTAKTNFIIELSDGYEKIYSRYRKDLKENIRKVSGLHYSGNSVEPAVALYRRQYQGRIREVSAEDYYRFTQLCHQFKEQGGCMVRSVQDDRGEVLATAILLKDSRRIYNIMNAITREGRQRDANDFLLDRVIHEFAGQSLVFDFEGSELPGVKAFYEKFGATDQPYFYYHYNGLPWFLRWLKG